MKTFTCLALCFLYAAFIGGLLCHATGGRDAPSGTVTVLHPAIKELLRCRESVNETLQQARCYEEAVIAMPHNFSYWSSLALLYLRADMGIQAHEAMNYSANKWLLYLQPHLEKENKNLTEGKLRWVDVLRFHHDKATEAEPWWRDEAIEMGLMLAKKFEMEHLPSDAHSVYYEFLLQVGVGESQVMDFHRRTGNILALSHTGPLNGSSIVFRLADGIQPIVDGIIEHVMSRGAGTFDPPLRRMCGIEFTSGDEIRAQHIVSNIDECVAQRWGRLSESIANETDDAAAKPPALHQWSASMRETGMHRLAVAGATGILREVFEFFDSPQVHVRGDRFGRGLTHMAAAWGRESTLRLLLDRGGDINAADAGGLTPRHLGCDSPGFRDTFLSIVGDATVCDGFTRNKIYDEGHEVVDDTGTDGGWNLRFKRSKYLHCDFDVRDAAMMTQSDLIAAYTHSNQPVVLRNSFYETDGPDFRWSKKKFNRTYGHVMVRQEYFVRQSRWGIGGIVNISNVSDWLSTYDADDGKVATVTIDHVHHPMAELADQWIPPTFTNKKRHDEVDFFDPRVTVSTVHITKRGSKSNHHVRAQSFFHTVVYGHEEWALLPPMHARTLRDVLPAQLMPFAQRCELITGDVLVVPDLWSASWTSKSNGISMERFLYKKTRAG